jgi:hypothetical protein
MGTGVTPRSLALLSLAVLLTGCASPSRYPSLGVRDAERATGTLQPGDAEPYVPPATPSETLDRIGQLNAEAQAAHREFFAVVERARASIAAGRDAAEGSDRWSIAQVALADVQASRSRTMIALAELDRLYVDTQLAGGDLARISAARDEVNAMVEAEDASIADLRGGL